ncbi:hypothetical protein JRO89_XS13G0217600 [Xanthoceras sorbifolium]|uniref:Uncharacterized protein n=1 Tax=Xanthoceras sorbifolium TaxID=99658 RepID=A0ABQ8H9E6_9ROSI|nr:hypothetical protein JRO89_XS13G0217600 [Xanthoceras sorbifolium]
MEVSIISREIIKPSSSNPNHLRTYNFSLMDQLNLEKYFCFLLFYLGPCKTSDDHLKKTLSKVLTHYYPFAGRVHDNFLVDCDDTGATFIEAKVAGDMSGVLKQPTNELLEQLVPQEQLSSTVILAVQVNHFNCGGVAISVGFRHVVADAVAAANFIKSWATVSSGGNPTENVVFDFTSIFPPQDLSGLSISVTRSSAGISIKRFVFDCSKIAALREEIGNQTTRFEVLGGLVWGAVMAAKRATNEYAPHALSIVSVPINLRKRITDPPIAEQCIGNIITPAVAICPMKEIIDYKGLAGKLRESISSMNGESVKKTCTDGNRLLRGRENKKSPQMSVLLLSSLCRLPFYETDFGWEKPVWTAVVRPEYDDSAVFFDTRDGKGIELWMQLPQQEMAKFEQDPTILAYASSNPSV